LEVPEVTVLKDGAGTRRTPSLNVSFATMMDWKRGGHDGVTNDVGGVGPGIGDVGGVDSMM